MKDPLAVANAIIWATIAACVIGLLLIRHIYLHT